jgi:hypothetical protein
LLASGLLPHPQKEAGRKEKGVEDEKETILSLTTQSGGNQEKSLETRKKPAVDPFLLRVFFHFRSIPSTELPKFSQINWKKLEQEKEDAVAPVLPTFQDGIFQTWTFHPALSPSLCKGYT